ncbi:hypothetical protein C7974DRAFT_456189 [Boeremia exigua]|uniref:uncharacterized protein n=1 Tax=Boeremia exigua TaxID=749465 RepID=UPI001E8D8F2E|nr:uncharacterized protein C7974DRAFT_456189 [Boeremia exigua]KAH6625861.1 hypothetical protein C7974DRAFT_456189 [Boeremia exigua]
MADYNKLTVAQLRQLLKDRGIPSTGLSRKAQIIEKLEEEDTAGTEVTEAGNATEDAAQESEPAEDKSSGEDDVPDPPLEEAGEPKQTAAETKAAAEPAPVPAPTADRSPETISHIDSDMPPPDETKAIERPAEDTTAEEEAGGLQPTEVFRPAPAAPEDDQVGPHITEPTDEEAEIDAKGEKAKDAEGELPEAPGPAAETLRLAQPEQETPAETQDTAMEMGTPSPAPNERDTVEKPELLPIPERSTAETSRLNTEELEADTKKRKRRSNSPDLTAKEALAKKLRLSQEPVQDVSSNDVVMEQQRPEDSPSDPKQDKKENLDRYKDLLQPTSNPPADTLTDDRPTIPAIHPVTPALYIRNLMRPLRPSQLHTHLTALATPPSSTPDPTLLPTLFLDAMKTHALALFTSPTAASRARAALHATIWPPEGNRKELWADFVPADDAARWIAVEEAAQRAEKDARAAGRPAPSARFEVVYTTAPHGVVAQHREVGAGAPANAPRGPRADAPVPVPVPPPVAAKEAKDAAPFRTLHELFEATVAKPQLFFLPVGDEVAEQRLEELRRETSREWDPEAVRRGRGLVGEVKYRYCFDDEGRVVEGMVEGGDGRGRGGGGFRGRGGGGWRGRGGGGWRG